MKISRENQKRIRRMANIEAADHGQPENTTVMESDLISPSRASLRRMHCRWNSIPKMSEEMVNVMSSFNMIDISTSDASPRNQEHSKENGTDIKESEGNFTYKGIVKKPSTTSKNSRTVMTANKRPTLSKAGSAPSPVQSSPKGRVKWHSYEADIEEIGYMERNSVSPICSSETQKLLERSSALYGRIDNLRESAKLERSTSFASPNDKMNLAAHEQVVGSYEDEYSITEADLLDLKSWKPKATMIGKQSSLKHSSRKSEEVNQGSAKRSFPFSPVRKMRSATIL